MNILQQEDLITDLMEKEQLSGGSAAEKRSPLMLLAVDRSNIHPNILGGPQK